MSDLTPERILDAAIGMLTEAIYLDLNRQHPERFPEWSELGFKKRNEWRAWTRRYVEGRAVRRLDVDMSFMVPLRDALESDEKRREGKT